MKIHNMAQYSDDWWDVRKGLPTASSANKILTPTGKLSATSRTYLNELIADEMGYGDEPMEPTEWMQRGTELEPEARAFFELDTGLSVQEVGFITNDDGTAGCSPDGLVVGDFFSGDPEEKQYDCGIEIKCPKASTHIGYLRGGDMPDYYKPQVHFSMAVTGFDSWHFMSYFPGLDPLIVLVERDDYTAAVEQAIKDFTDRLAEAREFFGLTERKAA